MFSGTLEVVEEGVAARGVVTTSALVGAAILKVLGVLRWTVDWGTEGFKAGKSEGETIGFAGGTSDEEDTREAVVFGAIEIFRIPGIDFLSVVLADETVPDGPVGIFLAVIVGDLTELAPGVGRSIV